MCSCNGAEFPLDIGCGDPIEVDEVSTAAKLDSAAATHVRCLLIHCRPLYSVSCDRNVSQKHRSALWPQARFVFANADDLRAFQESFKVRLCGMNCIARCLTVVSTSDRTSSALLACFRPDATQLAADFFQMQLLRETLLTSHGFDSSALPPLVACEPRPTVGKPTISPDHALRSSSSSPAHRGQGTGRWNKQSDGKPPTNAAGGGGNTPAASPAGQLLSESERETHLLRFAQRRAPYQPAARRWQGCWLLRRAGSFLSLAASGLNASLLFAGRALAKAALPPFSSAVRALLDAEDEAPVGCPEGEEQRPSASPPATLDLASDLASLALRTMVPLCEVAGDPWAATDPHVASLFGGWGVCHCCGYRRALVARCPHTVSRGSHAAAGARHTFCAGCLQRSLGADYHALRTGLLQWRCPVCTGACPCTSCSTINGGVRPYR